MIPCFVRKIVRRCVSLFGIYNDSDNLVRFVGNLIDWIIAINYL